MDVPAGYTYKAEIVCPECIWTLARREFVTRSKSLNAIMVEWAEIAGIADLDDEHSFDSDDFPKAFYHPCDDEGFCDKCGEEL